MTKETLHDQLNRDGFVVLKNFLDQQEIDEYKAASKRAIELAREGKWPEVRTRGKQFPPWPKNFSPDIWGLSGLLNPGWAELDPELPKVFQKVYANPKLVDAACDILQISKDEVVMELLNMLINPMTDFSLDWHRDDIKPEATAEEEMQRLALPDQGAQFNLSLCKDDCLIVVPKTHLRARTEAERAATTGSDRQGFIEGEIVVPLGPGDCVFYNNNILHRATYNSKVERITLHGSYGHPVNGKVRAENILQFGLGSWIQDFHPTDPQLLQMRSHLVKLIDENKDKPIKYSLDG